MKNKPESFISEVFMDLGLKGISSWISALYSMNAHRFCDYFWEIA
jgi:hypothetical protein